jgi:hypothetical protein
MQSLLRNKSKVKMLQMKSLPNLSKNHKIIKKIDQKEEVPLRKLNNCTVKIHKRRICSLNMTKLT